MSRSARRLDGSVDTASFPWQQDGAGSDETVVALFKSGVRSKAPRELHIPSLSAERIEAASKAGYEKGYTDGDRDGQLAASTQAAAMVRNLSTALKDLETLRNEMMRRSERDLVRLAIAMAERIVRREVEDDRELLLTMARSAVESHGGKTAGGTTIRLNPADHALLTRNGPAAAGDGIEVVADPTVPAGGCLVQSPFGVLDAGVDTQLTEMRRGLLGPESEAEPEARRDGQEKKSYDVAASA